MLKLLAAGACALTVTLVGTATAAAAAAGTAPTATTVPALYDNCTNFNQKYPHGVGRAGARDKTRSGGPGVTTFKRSSKIYNVAMKYNDDLDRDDDGVACEKD